jgi:hypothetical protein
MATFGICIIWGYLYFINTSCFVILVQGQIRSVIGQAKLLIAQRFKQFNGLVDNCEFRLGEKETTVTDLQGFWDMIYYQVQLLLYQCLSVKTINL